jgi:hypothetical protein
VHNGELHNLYSSGYIGTMKSRRRRWVGYVACMRETNVHKKFGSKPRREEGTWKT